MPYTPGRDARRTLRLREYDYSRPGAYFVTICAQARSCLFGEIAAGTMAMNDAGRMVAELWDRLPTKFPNVTVDVSVVMPNHMHGTLVLHECPVGVGPRAYPCPPPHGIVPPTPDAPPATGAHTGAPLPEIVGWFKTMSTNAYICGVRRDGWPRFEGRLWQRNYFERVLRTEERLNAARRYIGENPARWALDTERAR